MIAPNSHARQKKRGSGGRGERSGRLKKGRPNSNSDARRGRSHKSISVRDVGCEEQEKTWTVVWGFHSTGRTEGARD